MRPRRALVTGGAGFLGSHLADRLLAEGWEVTVLDDLSTGRRANLGAAGDRVRLVEGDVRDPAALARAAEGAGTVFHLAAVASVAASQAHPEETRSVNVGGTRSVLEWAGRAGARVVLASSCAVYGDASPPPLREDAPAAPASPYAEQKLEAEALCRAHARRPGQEAVVLRYFNIYGPRQRPDGPYAAVVPRFLEACLAERPPRIEGDGSQTRDFLYVTDAIRANLLAAAAPVADGRPCNVASGVETAIGALARTVCEITGFSGEPVYAPARPGDLRRSAGDGAAARETLGFEPEVDLRTGLLRTARAMRERREGDIAA